MHPATVRTTARRILDFGDFSSVGADTTGPRCFGTLRAVTQGDTAGEFDEEDSFGQGPLLPPEDRLWRHPSELAHHGSGGPLDAVDVRNRWIAREPTRATAWTAGLVGALLATGIVLVGTHLATVLTHASTVEQTAATSQLPASSTGTTVAISTVRGFGLGATLGASVLRLGGATVSVRVFRGSSESANLGIVLDGDGAVLTAAAALEDATTILVEAPHGGVDLVATVVATDARSGLAVLHVNRMPNLPTASLGSAPRPGASAFVLAITSPGGATYAAASLTSSDITPKVGGTRLVDATATDLPVGYAPLGSPVIDESGHMLGMVVGTAGGHAVLSPSWILGPIASELSALGEVSQGWMGINGTTLHDATHPARTTGVHVLAVAPRSAAAKAGLAPGDDITAIDANTVTSIAALQGRLYTERPGTVVDVGLIRRGTHETIRVTLAGAQS